MTNGKKIGSILGILGLLVLVGWGVWQFAYTPAVQPKIYTLADFPNATRFHTEPEELDRRVRVLNEIYALLGTNNGEDDSYHWLQIGTIKKILGDPVGAEQAWQESLKLAKSSVIFGNLANLYYLELEQPEKAIDYYNQAITIAPQNYSFYEDLAGVYRYKLGDQSDQVEATMLRGAEANQNAATRYYIYLVEYFAAADNATKRAEYVQKILALNPDEQTLQYLRSGGHLK